MNKNECSPSLDGERTSSKVEETENAHNGEANNTKESQLTINLDLLNIKIKEEVILIANTINSIKVTVKGDPLISKELTEFAPKHTNLSNINEINWIEVFGLSLESNVIIYNTIFSAQSQLYNSSKNTKSFYSLVILKIIMSMLVCNLDELKSDDFSRFISALELYMKITDDKTHICYQSFELIYVRLIFHSLFHSFIGTIDYFIIQYSLSSKEILNAHFLSIIQIAESELNSLNEDILQYLKFHVNLVNKSLLSWEGTENSDKLNGSTVATLINYMTKMAFDYKSHQIINSISFELLITLILIDFKSQQEVTDTIIDLICMFSNREPIHKCQISYSDVENSQKLDNCQNSEIISMVNSDAHISLNDFVPDSIDDLLAILSKSNHDIYILVKSFLILPDNIINKIAKLLVINHAIDSINILAFWLLLVTNLKQIAPSLIKKISSEDFLELGDVWKSKISFFSHTGNSITSLRKLIIEFLYRNIYNRDSNRGKEILMHIFIMLNENSAVFAELLYITSITGINNKKFFLGEILEQESSDVTLFTIIGNQIQMQQSTPNSSTPNIGKIRALTMRTLIRSLDKIESLPLPPFIDSPIHQSLLNAVADRATTLIASSILQKIYNRALTNKDLMLKHVFEMLNSRLDTSVAHLPESDEYMRMLLFTVFNSFVSLNPSQIENVCENGIFPHISSYIFVDGISMETVGVLLDVLHFLSIGDPENNLGVNFQRIANKIYEIGIDDHIFQSMTSIISGNHTNFCGIRNRHTLPFFKLILHSKYAKQFLVSLQEITNASVVQCYVCSSMKIEDLLMSIINTTNDNDLQNLALSTFESIVSQICGRPSFFSYMHLFHPNKDGEMHSQMNVHLLHMMMRLLANKAEPRPILQFTNSLHNLSIQDFPFRPLKDILGFSIVCTFANFIQNNYINIVSFSNEMGFFDVVIDKYSISIKSNMTVEKEYIQNGITIAPNKWMALFVYISSNKVKVYNDGVNIALIPFTLKKSFDQQTQCHIFEQERSVMQFECVHVQAEQLAVYLLGGEPTQEQLTSTELSELVHAPSISMLYNSRYLKDDKLLNLKMTNDCVCTAEYYPYVSSFWGVFVASKGPEFLIFLFSHFMNSKADDWTQQYAIELISSIGIIMKMKNEAQRIFLNAGCFELIAYFLESSDSIKKDIKLWNALRMLQQCVTDSKLRKSLLKSITLNYHIWKNSEILLKEELINHWGVLATSENENEEIFKSVVRLSDVLLFFVELRNEIKSSCLRSISTILISLGDQLFQADNINIIEGVLNQIQNEPQHIIMLLNAIAEMIKGKEKLIDMARILSRLKILVTHESIDVHLVLMNRFTYVDRGATLKHLTSYIFCVSPTEWIQRLRKELVFTTGTDYNDIISNVDAWSIQPSVFKFMMLTAILLPTSEQQLMNSFLISFISKKEDMNEILQNDEMGINMVLFAYYTSFIVDVKEPMLLTAIATLFCNYPGLFSKYFDATNVIGSIIGVDPRQSQRDLLIKFAQIASKQEKYYQQKVLDSITSFFMLIPDPINEVENRGDPGEEITLIISQYHEPVKLNYTVLANDGEWIEKEFCISIILILLPMVVRKLNFSGISLLASLAMSQPSDFVIPVLEPLISKVGSVQTLSPIIVKYHLHADLYKSSPMISDLGRRHSNARDMFEVASQNSVELLSRIYTDHILLSDEINQSVYQYSEILDNIVPPANLNTFIHRFETKSLRNIARHEKMWMRLHTSLVYDGSPYFAGSVTNSSHFKRGNFFDFQFRPIILTRNKSFNIHADASSKRGSSTNQNKEQRVIPYIKEGSGSGSGEKSHSRSLDSLKDLWISLCQKIKLNRVVSGTFHVHSSALIFNGQGRDVIRIRGDLIRDIFWCWTDQRADSIQIFTWDGRCYLFRFPGQSNHKFVLNLKKCSMPRIRFFQEGNPAQEISRIHLTKDWLEHRISTMEYLMWINLLSGRSFHSSRIYPIFPLIIDKNVETFDENNPEMYRDLRKNLGVIYESNIQTLTTQAEALADEIGAFFLHSSLYSNPFSVAYFLIREEPFTTLHIHLQDGSFDSPQRIFQSFPYIFDRIHSIHGFNREYPPEFFYDPDTLVNINGFDFGKPSDGEEIDDVVLPKWAKSPTDFIAKQRIALESDTAAELIGSWIDLIWGYSQVGEGAKEMHNTFSPYIYPDVWNHDYKDRQQVMGSLHSIGQVPQRIFASPHPSRSPLPPTPPRGMLVISQLASPVVSFKCNGQSINTIKLFAILQNGQFFCLKTSGSNFAIEPKNADVLMQLPTDPKLVSFAEGSAPSFAFVPPRSITPSAFLFNKMSYIRSGMSPHLDEISAIAVSSEYVMTGGKDAVVALWANNNEVSLVHTETLMTHSSPIVCLAISSSYGIAVSVSSDSVMVVSAIPRLLFIRKLSLGRKEVPMNILITNEMGYICVFWENFIQVYTPNGRLCAEREYEAGVVSACSITTLLFNDVIAVANRTNHIEFLQVHSLESLKVLCKPKERITYIKFDTVLRCIIAATENPLVLFLPVD